MKKDLFRCPNLSSFMVQALKIPDEKHSSTGVPRIPAAEEFIKMDDSLADQNQGSVKTYLGQNLQYLQLLDMFGRGSISLTFICYRFGSSPAVVGDLTHPHFSSNPFLNTWPAGSASAILRCLTRGEVPSWKNPNITRKTYVSAGLPHHRIDEYIRIDIYIYIYICIFI